MNLRHLALLKCAVRGYMLTCEKEYFYYLEDSIGATEMNYNTHLEVKAAFAAAIRHAIETVGVEQFKKTSMFGGNDKIEIEFKEAA